ncbi:MAG TPA: TrkA family potassium uptake protein [Gemmataceae bacterium]|nr:TrkA family potassium uptake protein [Gemmataceae bacterium]
MIAQLLFHVRFTRRLLWNFRWSLLIFWGLVFFGGWGLHVFYHKKEIDYWEACYSTFLIIFLQPNIDFPQEWFLRPFFFLLPIIGLGAVADSLVRLGYFFFAKKQNLPEWHSMVASSYHHHMVVVGAGKVGYHILKGLVALREPVVAIELAADGQLQEELLQLGVPVIIGNGRNRLTLEQAGVGKARAVILTTNDDLANLDAALTAREINPTIRVVLRLFDDTLASKFASAFQMPAISVSQVSAPAFIAAATGRKVYHSFELGGFHLHVTDLTIYPNGTLVGKTVGEIQANHAVNIVMHRHPNGVIVNPDHDVALGPNDTILVIATKDRLVVIEEANQPLAARK